MVHAARRVAFVHHGAPGVVGLVPGPAGDTFDLFDHPVVPFGTGVAHADGEEGFDFGPPVLDRCGQEGRLRHVRIDAGGEKPGPQVRGLVAGVGAGTTLYVNETGGTG